METAMIQATGESETTQTTDPREAKLRDIIEKGKASLHKALEEVQHAGMAPLPKLICKMVTKECNPSEAVKKSKMDFRPPGGVSWRNLRAQPLNVDSDV